MHSFCFRSSISFKICGDRSDNFTFSSFLGADSSKYSNSSPNLNSSLQRSGSLRTVLIEHTHERCFGMFAKLRRLFVFLDYTGRSLFHFRLLKLFCDCSTHPETQNSNYHDKCVNFNLKLTQSKLYANSTFMCVI